MNIYTVALKKIVEDKKYRLERDYDNKVLGISQIPFCLEKMVLEYRYKRPIPVNGQMFIGTVLHRHLFKDIIKTTYSMFDRIFLEFEKEIQFVADDYKLVGHVDCYDKRRKIVYEFKTTDNEHVMNTSLASAYQFQANCYVGILGARSYEIIILHRRFIDINDSVGVIKGEFDEEKFKWVKIRAGMITKALKENKDIETGPEFEWECNMCGYKDVCPKIEKLKNLVIRDLPDKFKLIDLSEEQRMLFEKNRRLYTYDRRERVYVRKKEIE